MSFIIDRIEEKSLLKNSLICKIRFFRIFIGLLISYTLVLDNETNAIAN